MPWILTYDDLFDREATPTVQATGAELLEGMTPLWNLHLREGSQDDGQRTFCRFDLRWGEPTASAEVDQSLPHHAAGARPRAAQLTQSGVVDGDPARAACLCKYRTRLLRSALQRSAPTTRWVDQKAFS